jgi:hypothetical protein
MASRFLQVNGMNSETTDTGGLLIFNVTGEAIPLLAGDCFTGKSTLLAMTPKLLIFDWRHLNGIFV